MANEIMVSICCITYNHENYISDAIESFLMQKTDFTFEILIHDDASRDNTAEIVKKYEKKYPNIIKPIYQEKNQYSKGINIDSTYNFPRAKGKYIAICEGDDYWIDALKLQSQVEYMEKHPDCSLCTHSAQKVSTNGRDLGFMRPNNEDKNYTPDEIIIGDGIFATNSMLFPTRLVQSLPSFYLESPVGDYPLKIYLSLCGNVHYLDKCMSSYRILTSGSWTRKMQSNESMRIEHNKKIANMLNQLNDHTNYEYKSSIEKRLIDNEIMLVMSLINKDYLKSGKYSSIINQLSFYQKLKVYTKCYFPQVIKLRNKVKRTK